jgi:hypothetical protein
MYAGLRRIAQIVDDPQRGVPVRVGTPCSLSARPIWTIDSCRST